ncbi:helix-turn-helix domain-containing protein [Nocardia cyriacigeorgica]|uniref:Anaerobic benzoate catabolism transcriptional regulator n=1 Tax=Nocardia cyriacigeorgica TaxID=135487 RepID=A0A4U8W357_9NOCA|nr:helix-turn-helix transcriptional regulator [Nocardia cyriacigeorgica]VFB00477.1 anaerobic benzoate catabolism transcriptional regulator [Nocardia cyriacigeorgica]
MIEGESVGARIARIRKIRGMTQHQLAAAANVSRSMLAQVEKGHSSASTVWVGAVANALRVDASRLYGDDEPEQLLDVLPILRRTLAATDLMDPDLEPEPIEQLRVLSAKVSQWRRDTQYRKIVQVLPDLVDRLLISGNEAGEPAYALLTDAYRAANTVAHKLGYSDLSLTATERMEWAATRSGDPLLLATTHYVKAATLARVGASQHALRLLTRAMADIEPIVDDDAAAAAVYSILHMRAATIAAAAGDSDTSRSHLAEAELLARGFGDRIVYDTPVGPTNVKLYQVCAEVDLGEPGRAIEIAHGTRLQKNTPVERQAYFWLDTARAHLLNGDPDAAITALYESRLASPEHFRSSPTVKNIVKTAATQQRRASDSLRSLANYAGLAD